MPIIIEVTYKHSAFQGICMTTASLVKLSRKIGKLLGVAFQFAFKPTRKNMFEKGLYIPSEDIFLQIPVKLTHQWYPALFLN